MWYQGQLSVLHGIPVPSLLSLVFSFELVSECQVESQLSSHLNEIETWGLVDMLPGLHVFVRWLFFLSLLSVNGKGHECVRGM